MILDKLSNSDCYKGLHPLFEKIFDYLKNNDLHSLKPGKIEFPQDGFYINVDEVDLRPKCDAYPEAHDRYIDIQLPITMAETIGYRSREKCTDVRRASEERDIVFYNNMSDSFFMLEPGTFAIFFPQDAHAPIIGEGRTRKIVVKVPVQNI